MISVDGIRACTTCREVLPADYDHFPTKGRRPDGTQRLGAKCRPCGRDAGREYYLKIKADPARYARHLKRRRYYDRAPRAQLLARERKQRIREEEISEGIRDRRLDAGPFREWLRERVEKEGGVAATGRLLGVSDDRVRTLLRGTYRHRSEGEWRTYKVKRVTARLVDRFLVAAADGTTLTLLYGDVR